MEEYTAVCICGRRVVLRLGPQAQIRQCPNCGASVRIPASSIDEAASAGENPRSGFEPPNHADISDEVSLFKEDDSIEPESPSDSSAPIPVTPPPKKEPSCSRCGRAFRGEWDEIETANGVFCHVCANLAFEKVSKKDTSPLVTETEVSKGMKPSGWEIFDEKQVREERKAYKEKRRKWEMIAFATMAAITLLIIYFWPQGSPTESLPPEKIQLSMPTLIFVYALMALFSIAATATTIYLTLQQTDRLAQGGLRENLPSVLWGALLLSIVWGVCSLVPIPLLPLILAIAVSVGILKNLYGFGGMDFVYYIVIGMVVSLLFWGIKTLVFGTLGIALS